MKNLQPAAYLPRLDGSNEDRCLACNTASSTWSESSSVMKPRGVVCQQAASKTLYCVIGTAKELCGFEEHLYLTRKTENTQAFFVKL
jgi:hypothetical protein